MGGFLPAGYPYNTMPFGQFGTGQSAAVPTPDMNNMTPQQYLDWLLQLNNSEIGQQAAKAQQQTIAFNVKQAMAAMEAERERIAIAKGQAEADKWYKQEQLKLAQQAHQLAVQTQQQNYELSGAALTGMFQGNPTLANLGQQAQYTGLYNGTPTLQAQNQQQQFGLQQGALTGVYQGAPTLAALNQQQQYGLQLGEQTGYQNGQATLSREQQAANAALQAAQIGASLQGPGNWAQYLQAANAVGSNPAISNLIASAPGGLGQAQGSGGGPMTLAGLMGQFGVMPSQYPSQSGQSNLHAGGWTEPAGQMYAGGTPGFNEQTGSYSAAPAGGMRSTMPVGGGAGGGTRAAFTDNGRGINPVNPSDPNRTRTAPGQPSAQQQPGWNPYSITGAIGQVASAPRPTNAQLGLTDQEAGTLQNWFQNPNQSEAGWWESKSADQKAYLQGLNKLWGGSPETFEERYRNSRPRQQGVAWNAA